MESNTIIKRSEQLISLFNGYISALEVIKEVSNKFDGKVINKRYFDFVNSSLQDSGINYKLGWSNWSYAFFTLRFWGDLYFTYRQLSHNDNGTEIGRKNSNIIVNNRLDYTAFVPEIDREIEEIKKMIEDKKNIINNGNDYKERMKRAVEEFNKVLESVPSEFRGGLYTQYYRIS